MFELIFKTPTMLAIGEFLSALVALTITIALIPVAIVLKAVQWYIDNNTLTNDK